MRTFLASLLAVALLPFVQSSELPGGALRFGAFTTELEPDGRIRIAGEGWPTFLGTWRESGGS